MYKQTVDIGDGKGKVCGLVLLQQHIDIAQPTPDKRVVPIDENWQGILALFPGKFGFLK